MRFTRWDQISTTGESNVLFKELASWHLAQCCASADRERVAGFLASDAFPDLCVFPLDVSLHNPSDAYHLNQALAFYRKRQDLDIGIDKREVAYVKFEEAEELCSETNQIFRSWSQGGFNFLPGVDSKLFAAQRKISYCLGDLPSLESLRLRFGPGATTQVTKRKASARRKLGMALACSEDLIPLLPEVLGEMPAWSLSSADVHTEGDFDVASVPVQIVSGNLSFVPKNAKTDRSIVVEPMLNQMVQLGIGDYISSRLKRVGIDTTDQTRNQKMARTGSITGHLATLDLSSASDTIARELVKHLLPMEWYDFLNCARTSTIAAEGLSLKLQKFSSMGNGFTFPLETLLFWALASVCVDVDDQNDVSVYGDDIIVPTYAYPALCDLLHVCGFIPNQDKSFASGPFRESCGKDYLSGIDIRPIFISDRLMGADAFVLHNFYVRNLYPEAAEIVLKSLDPTIHLWGPDSYGDGHLIGASHSLQRATLVPFKRDHGWAGYTFETYSWKGRKDFSPSPGDFVFPSYSIYMGCTSNPFEDRALGLITRERSHRYIDPVFRAQLFVRVGEFTGRTSAVFLKKTREEVVQGVPLPGTNGYKRIKIYTLA